MKKLVVSLLIVIFLGFIAFAGWVIFGPATQFEAPKYSLFVGTGMRFDQLSDAIRRDGVLEHPRVFEWIAARMDYPTHMKAGRYDIENGASLFSILRKLRSGHQTPVNLVITKLRTKTDLSSLIGKKFETDSAAFMQFLNNQDSLNTYHLDTNSVMTAILPDTYTLFWNTSSDRIFKKFFLAYKSFWTPERIIQAKTLGLTPTSVYILSSIVEEETTKAEDKGKIASVYLNRLSKGMKLAADPTVKFALGDFELKRIYDKQLAIESPYNTYLRTGLPPGPICTPSLSTIDAVLTAPKTNYLYFVAKPDFSGYSNFSENFAQHLDYAKQYQKALDQQYNQRTKDQGAN